MGCSECRGGLQWVHWLRDCVLTAAGGRQTCSEEISGESCFDEHGQVGDRWRRGVQHDGTNRSRGTANACIKKTGLVWAFFLVCMSILAASCTWQKVCGGKVWCGSISRVQLACLVASLKVLTVCCYTMRSPQSSQLFVSLIAIFLTPPTSLYLLTFLLISTHSLPLPATIPKLSLFICLHSKHHTIYVDDSADSLTYWCCFTDRKVDPEIVLLGVGSFLLSASRWLVPLVLPCRVHD